MDKKLKEILGEELAAQVAEKLGDTKIVIDDENRIPKSRFDEVNEEKNQLKEMLAERDKQLGDLKKQVKDNDQLTAQINDLQAENKKTTEEYERKLSDQRFSFAVEKAVAAAEAKNVKAVKALVDMEKVKLDGEQVIGLQEQLDALKESDPYLFGADLKGREPHKGKEAPPKLDNPWKPDTLNLTEQGRLLREDPETAKRLMAAAGVKAPL